MYAYFIDEWTSDKKYRRETDRLDLLLTQHGLSGRRIKLNRLFDLEDGIKKAAFSGARTFVAVGNDGTVSRLLNALVKLREEDGVVMATSEENANRAHRFRAGASLAVLPIGKEAQTIASALGCPRLFDGVAALKRQRTVVVDLGCLNQRHYFITQARFGPKVALGFAKYSVSSLRPEHEVMVCNTSLFDPKASLASGAAGGYFNPSDGRLEAIITYPAGQAGFGGLLGGDPARKRPAVECLFQITKLKILSPRKIINVMADVAKQFSAPVRVEVVPQALRVVVGEGFRG